MSESVRVSDYVPQSEMAPHAHDEASVIFVVNGCYVERIGSAEVTHAAGRVILYPAGATHSQRFGPSGARKVVFTPSRDTIAQLDDDGIRLDKPLVLDQPNARRLGNRLFRETCAPGPIARLARDGVALELFSLLLGSRRPLRSAPGWLLAARDMIHEAVPSPIHLSEIATAVGRHPVYVAREFRRYFNCSVGEMSRELRLEYARSLLESGASLAEIANRAGYASQSHFASAFKAIKGTTPGKYRDNRLS